jgi:hypothetical protein
MTLENIFLQIVLLKVMSYCIFYVLSLPTRKGENIYFDMETPYCMLNLSHTEVHNSWFIQSFVTGTNNRDAFFSSLHFGFRPSIVTTSGSPGMGALLLLSAECSGYCCGSLAGQACNPSSTHTR